MPPARLWYARGHQHRRCGGDRKTAHDQSAPQPEEAFTPCRRAPAAQGRPVIYSIPWQRGLVCTDCVRDIPDDARLVREEQFCPVVPVLSYDDIDDAVAETRRCMKQLGFRGVFALAVYLAVTTKEQVYVGALIAFAPPSTRCEASGWRWRRWRRWR